MPRAPRPGLRHDGASGLRSRAPRPLLPAPLATACPTCPSRLTPVTSATLPERRVVTAMVSCLMLTRRLPIPDVHWREYALSVASGSGTRASRRRERAKVGAMLPALPGTHRAQGPGVGLGARNGIDFPAERRTGSAPLWTALSQTAVPNISGNDDFMRVSRGVWQGEFGTDFSVFPLKIDKNRLIRNQ